MGRPGVVRIGPEALALADLDERGDEAIKDVYRTLASAVGGVEGDIVECGVYRGRNLSAICDVLPHRRVWAFDSFEGFPAPSEQDVYEGEAAIQKGQCSDTSPEMLVETLATARYNDLRIRPGYFEDTIAHRWGSIEQPDLPEQIAFLSVDCDLYRSVYLVLHELAHRVVPGGIIVLDDWGAFTGCRRAFYDWHSGRHWPLLRTIGPTQAYFHAPEGGFKRV